jgi:aldehyde dehydrogenase (NAD+)
MINEFHYNRVCELLKTCGGDVVFGNPNATEDKRLTMTVVLNPDLDSELMREEIFGPVFPLITYKTIEEAVEIIQSKDKPLVVYYFGNKNGRNTRIVKN